MRTLTEQEARAKRLRQAREAVFGSAIEGWQHAKKFVDVELQTYYQHENGNRGFKAHAEGYAKAFKVDAGWLLWGRGEGAARAVELPVEGRVAAGIAGDFDSFAKGDGGSTVVFDPEEISVVLQIDGMSMAPRYRDREHVLFGFKHTDPSPFIRREVFVQTKSGDKLFKVLQRGSRQGLWDLYSHNQEFDTIRDVEVEWVAPVKWHMV